MTFFKKSNLALIISCSLLSGCATTPSGKAAFECGLKGAGLGLLGGAATGALTSITTGTDMTKSVVIGAGAGAIVGGTVGAVSCYMSASHQSEKVEDYSIAKTALNYDASQGNKVKVSDFVINPSAVMVGGQINVESNYYVMTPDEKQDIVVTEQWIMEKVQETEKKEFVDKKVSEKVKVRKKWKTVTKIVKEEVINKEKSYIAINDGISKVEQHIKPGKQKSTTTLPIQAGTQKGTYRLSLLVQYGVQSDKAQQEFTVQ